jgi:hypothetical protein
LAGLPGKNDMVILYDQDKIEKVIIVFISVITKDKVITNTLKLAHIICLQGVSEKVGALLGVNSPAQK